MSTAGPLHLEPLRAEGGSLLERAVFNHRRAVIVACAIVTLLLAALAVARLSLGASFEKMIPRSHPYIQNYLENRAELRGLGNALRIVVEAPQGDIFDARYQATLRKIHDEVFLTPGRRPRLGQEPVGAGRALDRGHRRKASAAARSCPTTSTAGAAATEQLRNNIARAGIAGSLVGNDFKSSMLVVPLLDIDPTTGQRIDYRELSRSIEKIRAGSRPTARRGSHVIGFAKLVGDLIDGLLQVAIYFGLAAAIAAAIIWLYTRCVRSTALVLACSLVAVVWQLGIVAALGFELDPFSILVPFLVFAIGVSHGAQKMNGITQDIAAGAHKLVAAR
jgi:predicted RND superfamily exporter protein